MGMSNGREGAKSRKRRLVTAPSECSHAAFTRPAAGRRPIEHSM